MSNAGRVAIVPKGDYSATTQYDRLDAVSSGNVMYVAKSKPPIGTPVSDATYWMKSVDGNNANYQQLTDLKVLGYTVPSACPIQNEVNSSGQFVQKVGRVDLGTLTWFAIGSNGYLTYGLGGLIKSNGAIYCKKYTYSTATWTQGCIGTDGTTIWVGETVEANLSGVYLYYELATYKTLPIDGNEASYKSEKGIITNLLKPTLATQTVNGVTITNNGDGTYTLNGTASSQTDFILTTNLDGFDLTGKTLRMIVLGHTGLDSSQFYMMLYTRNSSNIEYFNISSDNTPYTLMPSRFNGFKIVNFRFRVMEGVTLNNVIAKPMLTTDLSATYDDFVAYTGSTGQLNSDVSNLAKGWELIGSVTGQNSVAIDSTKYSEFWIEQNYNGRMMSHHIISISLSTTNRQSIVGGFVSTSNCEKFGVFINSNSATNQYAYVDGTNNITSTVMTVYGKR